MIPSSPSAAPHTSRSPRRRNAATRDSTCRPCCRPNWVATSIFCGRFDSCFPGAAQHLAQRSGALQTRDRHELGVWNDPGSALHRFARYALHRIRETGCLAWADIAGGEIAEAEGAEQATEDDAERHEGEEHHHAGKAFVRGGVSHMDIDQAEDDAENAAQHGAEKTTDEAEEDDFHVLSPAAQEREPTHESQDHIVTR